MELLELRLYMLLRLHRRTLQEQMSNIRREIKTIRISPKKTLDTHSMFIIASFTITKK